jgi:hypothetical protein
MTTKTQIPPVKLADTSESGTRTIVEPAHVMLLLRPEKGSMAKGFTRSGPIRFQYVVSEGTDRTAPEVGGVVVVPGSSNRITYEEFQALLKTPHFERTIGKGMIQVIRPIPGIKESNSSLDFEVDDAVDLINEATDEKWLNMSLTKDERPGIPEACQERLNTLADMQKPRQ